MAVPKKKKSKAKGRSHLAGVASGPPARSVCPHCQAPRRRTWSARAAAGTRVAKRSRSTDLSRRGERPSPETLATLPVAVDAMGGDQAPGEIVEGARRAAEEHGIGIVLVGPPELVGDTRGLDLFPAPRSSAWTRTRPAACAARRTPPWCGRPSWSATARPPPWCRPATRGRPWPRRCCAWAGSPASCGPASPRRCRGWAARRPCWSTPGPTPSAPRPCSCSSPRWAPPTCAARFGTEAPSVGLLSIGEEPTKGTPLVKETHGLLVEAAAGDAGSSPASSSSATSKAATCCPRRPTSS